MPIVTIEGPKSDNIDARRKLADAVTEAAAEYYGMPRETIITLFKETPPDHVAVGGTLIVDRVGGPPKK